jgi:hypothetical protein
MKKILFICLTFALFILNPSASATKQWSIEKANHWAQKQGWLRGCNFIPSNAINQLEMWQADTFSPNVIDRELGWAQDMGMNCMRVFLHHAAWLQDPKGFKSRMNKYLNIAHKHGISTIFVFLDDCWNPTFKIGKQPAPKKGCHNSGWLQDPGEVYYKGDSLKLDRVLKCYIQDILKSFASDKRIVLWDLYNEPAGSLKIQGWEKHFYLLKKVFSWARQINIIQPISAGYWNSVTTNFNNFMLEHSDVITYHTYEPANAHQKLIDQLKAYGRPLICTEYMARTQGSTFKTIMPLLKTQNIGAINWGLVAGKTNTIFDWDSWTTPLTNVKEPTVWFHDILRSDGSPYSQEEINTIKLLTNKK